MFLQLVSILAFVHCKREPNLKEHSTELSEALEKEYLRTEVWVVIHILTKLVNGNCYVIVLTEKEFLNAQVLHCT